MSEAKQPKGLQVEDDRSWQEWLWTAQRVGWAMMGLLILAAFVGVTGHGGPLSSAVAKSGESKIDFPRVTRWQSSDQMTITIPSSTESSVKVELSHAFARLFTIESIEPEPSGSAATGQGQRYTFELGGGDGDKSIVFHVKASRPALDQDISVRVGMAAPAEARIMVLP